MEYDGTSQHPLREKRLSVGFIYCLEQQQFCQSRTLLKAFLCSWMTLAWVSLNTVRLVSSLSPGCIRLAPPAVKESDLPSQASHFWTFSTGFSKVWNQTHGFVKHFRLCWTDQYSNACLAVVKTRQITNQDTWVYTGLHFHLQPPTLHLLQSLKNDTKRDDSAWSLFGAGYLQVAAADVLKLWFSGFLGTWE